MKSMKAEAAGIRLIHIFGYEWSARKDILKSMLTNAIGYTGTKIYARNTVVREISQSDAKRFLNDNHRQGYTVSQINIGLFAKSDNQLVSVMSFSHTRPTMGKTSENSEGYELTRFANKINTTVVGGASKLFKHFIKTYLPTLVISYSDIAHTSGNMYGKLGFNKASESDPGYVWVNMLNDTYYNRVTCQKSNLPKLLGEPDLDIENNTERQIMESHGYARVFDSGIIRWEWRP